MSFSTPFILRPFATSLLSLSLLFVGADAFAHAASPRTFVIRLRDVGIARGLTITSIDLQISPGVLTGVLGLPFGWSMSITNGEDGKVRFIGSPIVGAAALPADQLGMIVFQFQEEAIVATLSTFECAGSIEAGSGLDATSRLVISTRNCRKTPDQPQP